MALDAIQATATLACASALGAYWLHRSKRSMKDIDTGAATPKRQRRMSFNSAAMAIGFFPEKIGLGEPIIHALVSFKDITDCPEEDDIVPLVETLMAEVERMAGIPKRYGGYADWHFEKCQNVDPKRMIRTFDVHHDSIDGMADEVRKLTHNYELRSSERNLPWWEFCLIKNRGTSESMLVFRVDHTIGGGLSLGRICTKIITHTDGSPVKDFMPPSMRANKGKQLRRKSSSFSQIHKNISAAVEVALLPLQRFDHGIHISKNVIGRRKDSHNRKFILFDPCPLDYVKQIKKNANASLNEILVCALSQAIHDFCHHSDCPVIKKHGEKTLCKASMTYGFPSDEGLDINDSISNDWVPLSLDLGVGHTNLRDRLHHIKEKVARLRDRPLAQCLKILLNTVLPRLPVEIYRNLSHLIYAGHSLTSTNVPGPDHQVSVAGKPVSAIRFGAPHSHTVFSILSYNGILNMTLVADDEAIPGIHLFPQFFTKALIALGDEFNVDIPQSLQS